MKPQTMFLKLSSDEFEALRSKAQNALRHPRDEARLILRHALLGDDSQPITKLSTNANIVVNTRQGSHDDVCA
jgi:hypothetical protein